LALIAKAVAGRRRTEGGGWEWNTTMIARLVIAAMGGTLLLTAHAAVAGKPSSGTVSTTTSQTDPYVCALLSSSPKADRIEGEQADVVRALLAQGWTYGEIKTLFNCPA